MMIFDAHLDLALNAVDWNRDLRNSVDDIRAQEKALGMKQRGRARTPSVFQSFERPMSCLCDYFACKTRKEIDHDFGHTTPEEMLRICSFALGVLFARWSEPVGCG